MNEYRKNFPKGKSHSVMSAYLIFFFVVITFSVFRALKARGNVQLWIILFIVVMVVALVAVMYFMFAPQFIMEFYADSDGIHAKCPLFPKMFYAWENIHILGISSKGHDRRVFFSTGCNEYDIEEKEQFFVSNKNRIVLSICDEYRLYLKMYMPGDIADMIECALSSDEKRIFSR